VTESADIPHTINARCPRCGYDLRGEIATWTEACPLFGRCTECGLDLAWGDVLDPRGRPRWNIEYAHGLGRTAMALPFTAALSFLPRYFWRRLCMTLEPRWRRLAFYVGVWFLVCHLSMGAGSAAVAGSQWSLYASASELSMLDDQVAVMVRAFILPYSSGPMLRYRFKVIRHPSQQGVHTRPLDSWFAPLLKRLHPAALLLALFTVALPASFVTLPVSRRQARVRWRHLARIFTYGLLFPALAFIGMIAIAATAYLSAPGWSRPSVDPDLARVHLVVIAAALMLALWWWCAIRWFLRMSQPGRVGLSVVGVAMMFALAATYIVYPDAVTRLISRILFPLGA